MRKLNTIIGALSGVLGICSLFFTEQIIAGIFIILSITILFGSHLYYKYKAPYSVESIGYKYDITCPEGKEADVIKTKRIKVDRDNVQTIMDRPVYGSGELIFVSSSHGDRTEWLEQGGGKTLLAQFNFPLKKDSSFVWEIRYKGINCFTDDRENVTVLADRKTDLQIEVTTPEERKTKSIRSYMMNNESMVFDLEKPEKTNSDRTHTIRIPKLRCKKGYTYAITWEW